jgi:hypothetical protein
MRAIAIAVIVTIIACTACCAEDKFCVIEKEPKAKGPIGAVVETAGVFAGKIASATEIAFTGERKITVENETGECRIFPFCATTKVADEAFHTATFNQLQKGKSVKVEYKEESGVAKAEKVIIESGAEKATPATATK